MRIIAGKWRGRPLVAPAGAVTRPTADRVREALFSMLTSRLGGFEGLAVLDAFAGTGALGLEALSQGAARCTFVEPDRAALAALRANLAALGAEAEVRAGSAAQAGGGPYDLLLLDPPYGSGLGDAALAAALAAPGAWASIETASGEVVTAAPGWTVDAERRFGKARITLLRHAA